MNSVKSEIIQLFYSVLLNKGIDTHGPITKLNKILSDNVIIKKSDLKERLSTVVEPRSIRGEDVYECISRFNVYTRLIVSQKDVVVSGLPFDNLRNTTESKLINYLDDLEDYDPRG